MPPKSVQSANVRTRRSGRAGHIFRIRWKRAQRKTPRKRLPRRPKLPRKRKRRTAKQRKANLKRRIRRDKVRVFGKRRKRRRKEFPKETPRIMEKGDKFFEDVLSTEQKKPEQAFPWTDEESFIAQLLDQGFSEREAYTLWFS